MWNSERLLRFLRKYRGLEESFKQWIEGNLYEYEREVTMNTGKACSMIQLAEGFTVYHGTENQKPTPRVLQQDRKITYSERSEFRRLGYNENTSLFVSNRSTVDELYGGTEVAIVWKDRVLCRCPLKNTFGLRLRKEVNLMDLSNKENIEYIINSVCKLNSKEDEDKISKRKVLGSLLPEAFPTVGKKVGRFSDYSKDYLIMRLLCDLIPECNGFYFSPHLSEQEAKDAACFTHHEEICVCDIELFDILPNKTDFLSNAVRERFEELKYPFDVRFPVILDSFSQEKEFTIPNDTFLLKSIGDYGGAVRGFKNLLFSKSQLAALPNMNLLRFEDKYYLRTTKIADNVLSKTNNELKIKRLDDNDLKKHIQHTSFQYPYEEKHNYNLFEVKNVQQANELDRTFRLTREEIGELIQKGFQGVVGPMWNDNIEEMHDVLYVFDETNLTTHSLTDIPYIDTFLDAFPIYTASLKYVTLFHNLEDNLPNSETEKSISCVTALTITEELIGKSTRGMFNVIEDFDHSMVDFS